MLLDVDACACMVMLVPPWRTTFSGPLLQVGRCASDLPKDFAPHPSIVKLCAKRRCAHPY